MVHEFNFFAKCHLNWICFGKCVKLVTLHHKVFLYKLFHILKRWDHGVKCFSWLTCCLLIRERKVPWLIKRHRFKLKHRWLIVEFVLELVDLIDALNNFLMTPFFWLNIQVSPNDKFSIQTRMKNLFEQVFSHIHNFWQKHALINWLVLTLNKNLHSLIS